MKERLPLSLEQIFQAPIRAVAVSVGPLTIGKYYRAVNSLLHYLQAAHPRVHQLSQLHRDPHILGWLRWMCEKEHPLSNITRLGYILCLRRLLAALEVDGLILRGDLPRRDQYLPRPLSPEDDALLDRRLRSGNDLLSNALLLIRSTGIRVGECVNLSDDCLRSPWVKTSGHSTSLWGSCTPNGGSRWTKTLAKSSPEFLRCAQMLSPFRSLLAALCCRGPPT